MYSNGGQLRKNNFPVSCDLARMFLNAAESSVWSVWILLVGKIQSVPKVLKQTFRGVNAAKRIFFCKRNQHLEICYFRQFLKQVFFFCK